MTAAARLCGTDRGIFAQDRFPHRRRLIGHGATRDRLGHIATGAAAYTCPIVGHRSAGSRRVPCQHQRASANGQSDPRETKAGTTDRHGSFQNVPGEAPALASA
jgi:hypothetical protein